MNSITKQRVVGALVLIALAVIIIPLVFDFSEKHLVDTHSLIPEMPQIEPIVVSEPVRPEGIAPAKPDDEIFQFGVEDPAQSESLDDESPSLAADGLPVSWVLQVGSFKNKEAAEKLVVALNQDGYKSFLRKKSGANGQLSQVFVGPKVLKKKLIEEKTAIDIKYKVKSLVLRFEP